MNLPTKLTFIRLLITPIFVVALMLEKPWADFAALFLFLLGMATDTLDGWLARSFNQVTRLGMMLDPLADKILVTSAFIYFVARPEIALPAWMVVVIVSREFAITGLRLVAADQGVIIPAGRWGKHKTLSQVAAVTAALLFLALQGYFKSISDWLPLVKGLAWLCVILTAGSGFYYFFHHWRLLRSK